jgi:preprotein translocase subunit SecE
MSEELDANVEAAPSGPKKRQGDKGESLPTRAREFVRESISELRRVVWPTRKQVVTYTIVVMVFVTFMSLFVSLVDLLVGRGVLVIFGN